MIICVTDFCKSVHDLVTGLLVKEIDGGFHGQYGARIIQRRVARMLWEVQDGPLIDRAIDATVVNDEAVELGWTYWCLQ